MTLHSVVDIAFGQLSDELFSNCKQCVETLAEENYVSLKLMIYNAHCIKPHNSRMRVMMMCIIWLLTSKELRLCSSEVETIVKCFITLFFVTHEGKWI